MISGIVATLAGIGSHVGYFNRGEHHMYGVRYFQIFAGSFMLSITILAWSGTSLVQSLFITSALYAYFFAGLTGSLVIYRNFVTPLRRFPGPWLARLSSLGFSAQVWRGDAHTRLLALHKQYGAFVRVGSSDVSIVHPDAIDAIYGRGSRCLKSDWYDLTAPLVSLQTTRKRHEHDQRRRVWATAFSEAAMRSYEERLAQYQDQLIHLIDGLGEMAINITQILNMYTFDVMGDLAFDESFHMIRENANHKAISLLHSGLRPLGWYLPMWLFRLLLAIPGAMADWLPFLSYCCERVDERIKRGQIKNSKTPNIMTHLLSAESDGNPASSNMNMLYGDSQLIIIAGSDTTSSALTCILYELTKDSHGFSKLRDEISDRIKTLPKINDHCLQSLDLLNGVINEALRLYPPAGMLQRLTPVEGLQIGDTHIPGRTTVFCPFYAMGRSNEVYVDAEAFRPERWSKNSKMVKEPSAFAPFSLGPYNCLGKPHALMNLRTTLAKLIMTFDISLAKGEEGKAFYKNMRTNFTFTPGELYLQFRKRQ